LFKINHYPIVSIIITTFQRSELLERSLNSVLKQTYPNIEIIIVDDNPPYTIERYNTEKIISQHKDSRITYIKHEKNFNGAVARNTGIRISKGNYITFLDDDDEFIPNRIDILVKAMENSPSDYGVAYTKYTKFKGKNKKQKSREKIEGSVFRYALSRSVYIGSGSNMFFRKHVIEDIGLFDETFLRNQDLEFFARALQKNKLLFVNHDLLNIYIEKRTVHFDFEESIIREKLYQNRFKAFLLKLPQSEQNKVVEVWGLDVLRLYFMYKQKGKLSLIKKYHIKPLHLVKFLIYVIIRKITRSSFGFKI
jgi:glycosyltransferase involved in cell wall biosynthesis